MLLNLGEPGGFDIAPWADRVRLIDAEYDGTWELPALGDGRPPPAAVLIRPDGYVAWVGDGTETGLADALTTWFGRAGGGVAHRTSSARAAQRGGPHAGGHVKSAALPARPSSQTGHRGADGQVRCRRGSGEWQTWARGRTVPGRRVRG